jgi:hypothetical protein
MTDAKCPHCATPFRLGADLQAARDKIAELEKQAILDKTNLGYANARIEELELASDAGATELRMVRAIIDKLPKTADGVVVVPGVDFVWEWDQVRSLKKNKRKLFHRGISVGCDCGATSQDQSMCTSVESSFSTPEAAQLDKEQQDD